MIKRTSVLLLISISLFLSQCKIIDFSDQDLFIVVAFEKTYSISSSSTSFLESEVINLTNEFNNANVDPEKVTGVKLTKFELEIIENNTGNNTTVNGNISFEENTGSEMLLATFSNINLNTIINSTSPVISVLNQLELNPSSVAALTNAVQQIPPPAITFHIGGSVNQPPVDFAAKLIVNLQVQLEQ